MRDKEQPLHIKYRPTTFDEMIGNEATVEKLQSIVGRTTGEVRSFLFTGPSGCGKTSAARILKTELGCSDRDYVELNSASVRGIDTIREIEDSCRYAPMSGKVKMFVFDECQQWLAPTQNAALKLLESSPKHVRFVLCTTNPEKLLKTIHTRCSPFNFSSLRKNQTIKLLQWVCKEENTEVSSQIMSKIAEYSDGSPRQALVLLDQIIDVESEDTALQMLVDASVGESNVLDLCQALLMTNSKWETISKILINIDEEPEKIRIAVLSYFGKILLSKDSSRVADMMIRFTDPFYHSGKGMLILACYLASKEK
jgi:DNA polymerase-3 subunit gamma/tau